MLFSSTCTYAIGGMIQLAKTQKNGNYVLLRNLCRQGNLPYSFMAKIFQSLVHEGLLISSKGRGGGFALARPAEEIYLAEIVVAIEGRLRLPHCVIDERPCQPATACSRTTPCSLHKPWGQLHKQISGFLTQTTLATLSGQNGEKNGRG